tara:strand:+ start:49 stop:747 length:699 start_codon:yes stop_codon:yes gene_type:complete
MSNITHPLTSYLKLCILEGAILRRSRIDILRTLLTTFFTDILENDEDIQELLITTISSNLSPSSFNSVHDYVLARLADYEYADIEQCLKQAIASWAMLFRLSPLTADANTLNYDDILINLDSKRQAYVSQLQKQNAYTTHEDLLIEHHETLNYISEEFINTLALNLFEPDKFKEFFIRLHCKAVKLFTAAHEDNNTKEAHEYMYGHVKAPFKFMSYERVMKTEHRLFKEIFN